MSRTRLESLSFEFVVFSKAGPARYFKSITTVLGTSDASQVPQEARRHVTTYQPEFDPDTILIHWIHCHGLWLDWDEKVRP